MKYRQFSLDRTLNSSDLFKLTQYFAYEDGTCLLYSGSSYETAQFSYLFLFPFDTIKIQGGLQQRCCLNFPIAINEANPWEAMKILGNGIGKGDSPFPEWSGFFGYEMGAYSDEDVVTPHHLALTPEAYWQRCAVTLRLDHKTGNAVVQLAENAEAFLNDPWKNLFLHLSTKEGWDKLIDTNFIQPQEFETINSKKLDLSTISDTLESYIDKIGRAKEFIKSGDVYQINLSQQWEFLGERDPFDLFKRLALLNPAPFSAYLNLKEFSIISSSPERFLQKRGQNLETRPIKGTAPRGKTAADDAASKQGLLSSEKERAELMMITDLMRNDLGKISAIGSIDAPLLCGCEAYQNVFHLFSIVKSRVLPTYGPVDIVRSCFPGGSITGCPKIRAMEVIEELEKRPRGIYTGSIGYFSHNGDFDFNIAIRTIVLTDKKIVVQLGGAIVIDSDPVKEYEETFHKGRSIFEILNSSSIDLIPVIQ